MTVRVVSACINAYVSGPLSGCVNDGKNLLADLCDRFGYVPSNTRLCVDARATRSGILRRVKEMRDVTTEFDVGIFHYSGHGTQVPTRDIHGDIDGLDEALVPFDFDWDDERTWIRDDDLIDVIRPVWPGAKIIVISDSCHSGDLIDAGNDRENPRARKARYLPPPDDIAWRTQSAKALPRSVMSRVATIPGVALLSGCQSTQTSSDAYIEGQSQGAFTWALRKWLAETPNASIRSIVENAAKSLKNYGYEQVPTCSGDSSVLNGSWPR
jgi:hypothetical protein